MNEFRTVVSTPKATAQISLKHRILTIGSCFSDTIGQQLRVCKFDTLVNPFGVIYNPFSIHSLLAQTISNTPPASQSFLISQDIHLHYDYHSSFGALTRETLESNLIDKISRTHAFIEAANWLIITYGTAWVYELAETHQIVANCHKMPAALFQKRLMTTEESCRSFREMYDALKKINPDIKIVVTVSPVRHIKDTLPLNQVSKSVLRLICHTITTEFQDVEYFPSYEMMIDDLRDYRFYKSDMIHPTEQAEDYIWKNFIDTLLDTNAQKFVNEWKSIRAALSHRAFHIHSSGHQNFLQQTIRKLEALQPAVDVSAEIAALKSQLKS